MNTRRKFILCLTGTLLPFVTHAQNTNTIRMVYADGIPPYSFFDKNQGKPRGILIDLINKVFSEAGILCSHQAFPWQRAQQMLKNGDADGLCAPPTESRRQYLNFYSEHPVTTLRNQLIFVRPDNPKLETMKNARRIEDFYNLRTATFLGNGTDSAVLKSHPNSGHTDSIDQLLVLLANNRIDFFAADPIVTLFKIRQMQKSKPDIKFSYFHKPFLQNKGQQVTMELGIRKTLPGADNKMSLLGTMIKNHITPDFEEQVTRQYIGEFFGHALNTYTKTSLCSYNS